MTTITTVTTSTTVAGSATERLHSLDLLRGIIILTMLFVNDIAGVPGTPTWMQHARGPDAMTFVDLVFPGFLFMVGMALPFALGRRRREGETSFTVWRHILTRFVSLLALGVLMVNGETATNGGPLSVAWWETLMYGGVILLWNDYRRWPAAWAGRIRLARLLGAAILVALVVLYHGEAGAGWRAVRPQWWGILGLIGWAYLAALLVYLPARGRLDALLAGLSLLLLLHMADWAGGLDAIGIGRSGANLVTAFAPHGAIVLAGAMLGRMLTREPASISGRVRWTLTFAAGLYIASMLLHALLPLSPMFGISKNAATPAWCLRCAAMTAALWLACYLLVDVAGIRRGTRFLARAGTNALFAYVLAPFVCAAIDAVFELTRSSLSYGSLAPSFGLGLARAFALAFGLTWLAGFLKNKGFDLKL